MQHILSFVYNKMNTQKDFLWLMRLVKILQYNNNLLFNELVSICNY